MKKYKAWYQMAILWIEDNQYISIPLLIILLVSSFWIAVYEATWLWGYYGL